VARSAPWEGGQVWTKPEDLPSLLFNQVLSGERQGRYHYPLSINSKAVTKIFIMKKMFIVAAFITSSQLSAQDTTALADVTVSANKFATKTTETGKVVHIITRQDIERAGARDLSQILNEQGGVYINGANSSPGKDKNIYLRGAKVDYTLITIDGVPVYDASGIGSNFDIRQLSLDLVERIEVLKGSQGTLYGSDAVAGVINIITKKAPKDSFKVYGNVSGGSVQGRSKIDTRKLSAGAGGRKDNVDYNFGLSHFSTDGISEAFDASTNFEKDAYRQNTFTGRVGIQAGKTLRIEPFFRYSTINADLDQEPFVDEKDFTSENKNFQAGVINQVGLGKAKLNVLYQFNRTSRDYTDDSTESRNGYAIYSHFLYESSEHYGEAYIVYPSGRLKFTGGLDLRTAGADYSSELVFPPFPPSPPSVIKTEQGHDSVHHNQLGAYTAMHYSANGFNLEAGGRLNLHSEYGSHFAFNVNPSILAHDRIKVFANASSGFKTPSLYQLFGDIYGNADLKPESSINLEGGIQLFTKNNRGNVRLMYFQRKVDDVIIFYYDPVTFKANYINQDEQKDNGIEVDLAYKPSDKLSLKLFYSHVEGEVTTKLSNGKDTTFSNFLRRPENNLNFHLGYQFTKRLYISTQIQGVGKSHDVYFDPSTFTVKEVELDDYMLIHLYTEYGFSKNRLKAFLDLRDITDIRYTEVYGYSTPGLQWYAGLRFSF
jgi:vitamin B12 transporter